MKSLPVSTVLKITALKCSSQHMDSSSKRVEGCVVLLVQMHNTATKWEVVNIGSIPPNSKGRPIKFRNARLLTNLHVRDILAISFLEDHNNSHNLVHAIVGSNAHQWQLHVRADYV